MYAFEVAMEAQYDEWLAAKKHKADWVCLLITAWLLLAYFRSCLGDPRGEMLHILVGVALTCLWAWTMICRLDRYPSVRGHIFALGWYNATFGCVCNHTFLEKALDKAMVVPSVNMARLVGAKWALIFYLFYLYRPKLSAVPQVQFVGLLFMNAGAYNAASAFEHELAGHVWVQALTAYMNAALRHACLVLLRVVMWQAPHERHVAAAQLLDVQLLSSRQCTLLTWLLLQGAVFWLGYWLLAREELRNRRQFLRSHRYHAQRVRLPSLLYIEEMVVQLCCAQMYIGLLLLLASGSDPAARWPSSHTAPAQYSGEISLS